MSSMNDTVLPVKRKRKSRLVVVNGQSVFKANMYSMEEGEPSVWGKELDTNSDSESLIERERDDPVRKKQVVRKSPGIVSSTQRNRLEHNNIIRLDKSKGLKRRQNFIRANWKLIKPFLTAGQPCPSATNEVLCFPELTSQPFCLANVTMRNYQLEGVNWLIRSYASGINVILGG